MSMTRTSSHTVTDVRRVFDSFAADYDMIAQVSGLQTQQHVSDVVHDVKTFSESGYLDCVSLVLSDRVGSTKRARKYTVSTSAAGWTTDQPGDNLWPTLSDGSLTAVLSYSQAWKNLSEAAKQTFKNGLRIKWGPSGIDLSFPGLTGTADRKYASNGYGVQRTSYR